MRIMIIGALAAATVLSAGCTTRGDVRDARVNLREAHAYGDRRDVRDARRNLRETRRDYHDDNQCGPQWGRPC